MRNVRPLESLLSQVGGQRSNWGLSRQFSSPGPGDSSTCTSTTASTVALDQLTEGITSLSLDQSSLLKTEGFTSGLSEPHLCACWCQGWAEIHIRHPTGNFNLYKLIL